MRCALGSVGAAALALAGAAAAHPTNVGHRGGSAAAPENTLATYDLSLDAGTDWLELDVWLSADGIPVCHHDKTLDRTTNGTGLIEEKTYAELALLDAGSWFGPEFAGEPIPTLAEALALIQGRGKVLFDVKQATAIPTIAAVVDAVGFPHEDLRIWIRFSRNRMIPDFQSSFPEGLVLQGSSGRFGTFEQDLAAWADEGLHGIIARFQNVDAEFVRLAQSYGLVVFVNTVSSPYFEDMIELGVDGLVVSSPQALASLLPQPDPACSNGIDDDGDGDTDYPADPGCFGPESDLEGTECSDGLDNDGDGAADHPADPGCFAPFTPSESPACDNGADDNGDGFADYPEDPGCFARYDQREGLGCGDGLDNDGDGLADADDPNCWGLLDPDEAPDCDNATGDADADGVGNACDNCYFAANPSQYDADGDGYGNVCDADLNQDGIVGVPDFSIFKSCFGVPISGAPCDAADLSGDGEVGVPDFFGFRYGFGRPPGP